MSTATPASAKPAQALNVQRLRGCLFFVKRGLKWFGIILVALVLLGVVYQAVAVELDKRNYSPRGQLYTVNGHQMHMICMGEGSPAVILASGAVAESLWWYRVQNQLADLGFRCKAGNPDNLKLCTKGTWNDRMLIETAFSLLTVICHAKKMFHRTPHHLEARLAYTAAMFNVLIALDRRLHPDHAFTLSLADFSL